MRSSRLFLRTWCLVFVTLGCDSSYADMSNRGSGQTPTVQIQTRLSVPAPERTSLAETLLAMESARRDLYASIYRECETLRTTSHQDCRVKGISISTQIVARTATSREVELSATTAYELLGALSN